MPVTLEFLAGQAEFMRVRGVELVFVSSPGPEQQSFAERERAQVHSVSMSRRITPFADLRSLVCLTSLFYRLAPTIVHAHTPKAGLLGMLAAKGAGVPSRVYHVHGLPYESAKGLRRFVQMISERMACALATRVLSVSESVRVRMVQDGACSPAKIDVPGQGSIGGIDPNVFDPGRDTSARLAVRNRLKIPPQALVVGFVGRLAVDKGIETLSRAWTRLRKERSDVQLLVIGPEENSRADQSLPPGVLEQLKTDPRVHLLGFIPRSELPRHYAAMDVLILPTHREGFPVTVLEAAAMGLPCVASRVTGCVDAVIPERTGFLIPPADADALVAAVHQYLDHPELRQAHGGNARARVLREFAPERLWAEYYSEYERLSSLDFKMGRDRLPAASEGNRSMGRSTRSV